MAVLFRPIERLSSQFWPIRLSLKPERTPRWGTPPLLLPSTGTPKERLVRIRVVSEPANSTVRWSHVLQISMRSCGLGSRGRTSHSGCGTGRITRGHACHKWREQRRARGPGAQGWPAATAVGCQPHNASRPGIPAKAAERVPGSIRMAHQYIFCRGCGALRCLVPSGPRCWWSSSSCEPRSGLGYSGTGRRWPPNGVPAVDLNHLQAQMDREHRMRIDRKVWR